MKRSDSSSGIKRSYSDSSTGDIHEDTTSSIMLLSSQNKSLVREMHSFKRELADARKELELMRQKSREMEGLVGAIQRGWSQLDIDASMLLDVLGDADSLSTVSNGSELLLRLLNAGSALRLRDPTDLSAIPSLNVDQWSTPEEVEQERKRVQNELLVLCSAEGLQWDDSLGGAIDSNISQHAGFTLTLLERVCVGLSESGVFDNVPEIVEAMINTKTLQAERLLMRDRIAKLSSEIVDLRAKIHVCDQKRMKCEKIIDRQSTEMESLKDKIKSCGQLDPKSEASASSASSDGTITDPSQSRSLSSDAELEYKRTIALLEKQLAESETAKSKVEMTLTERLARPLSQTEAQVADMRRAMEELRTQCKQRVAVLFSECTELQDKVSSLELAIEQIEHAAESRCSQIVSEAEAAIKLSHEERDKAVAELVAAKAEVQITAQLKAQWSELQALEATTRLDATKLREKLKQLTSHQEHIDAQLVQSRKRESALEAQIASSSSNLDTDLSLLLEQARARADELEASLATSKASVNDLFLEIEAVSAEDARSREQNSKLVRQVREGQAIQEGILEENLRLQSVAADKERMYQEMKLKVEAIEAILKQQDLLITSQRKTERALRSELASSHKSSVGDAQQQHMESQDLVEANQNLSLIQKSLSAEKKRNSDLQSRCDDLTSSLEKERKLRMTSQRTKTSKGGGTSAAPAGASTSLNGDDATMLNMTLTMLRCSVCKDRFKDCAITRCFHLFCKECIDENLRNRHRKCPACGEKFGQDDVKSVYFTH